MTRGFIRPRRARFIALFAVLALLWQTAAAMIVPPPAQGTDNPICSAHPGQSGVPAPVQDESKAKTLCGLCSYCPGGHAAGLISAGVAQPLTTAPVIFHLALRESSPSPASAPFGPFRSRAPPADPAA